ncbi:hypothetical protein [Bdellovibrio sp. HCB337]|uniref:hypothetical protein n=1 Tax=Bdellovibrio sp. HCB337 TaxID=3394358 RepID=UPI0039A6EBA8
MKKILVLIQFLFVTPAFAVEGWDHGNAGDSYAAEFVMTAKDLVLRLKTLPSTELRDVNLALLIGAIETTTVRTEDQLIYKGREVEAVNDPDQKLIVLNRSIWRTRRSESNTIARYTFVLHEYLGIMRVSDEQYKVSGPLVALLDLKNYNPAIWWNPLNPVNYISMNMIYSSGSCKIEGLKFDLQKTEEVLVAETTGDCGDDYRKVVVAKSAGTAPPSSNARGTFHRFQLAIFDTNGTNISQLTYEPEWGRCLGPQEGACASSGKLLLGGIEFVFLLRP